MDDFYKEMSAVWRQLDSLGADVCRRCQCCVRQQAKLEVRRLYDFLTRLRPEFEQSRAQLLARHPRLSTLEALAEVRSEEVRLGSTGLLPSSSESWLPAFHHRCLVCPLLHRWQQPPLVLSATTASRMVT